MIKNQNISNLFLTIKDLDKNKKYKMNCENYLRYSP